MGAPTLRDLLDMLALADAELPALLAAESYSLARLDAARGQLASIAGASTPGTASFALGSLGRREASPISDLDLAFVYDSARVDAEHAERLREEVLERLRVAFEVPEKTFRAPVDLRALVRNVGGERDTNEHLTYRALLLTEGAWLHNQVDAGVVKHTLFTVYAEGATSRGRFLGALANDLQRYYRTLCVDYRFKVEEQDKTWAIRIFKLRHARKLWHLANLALACWAADAHGDEERDEERDAMIEARLDWPPLVRLTLAMEHFEGLAACRPVLLAYEGFLAALSSPAVRDELSLLSYERRESSAAYRRLYETAAALDRAAGGVVAELLRRSERYLLRFWLL